MSQKFYQFSLVLFTFFVLNFSLHAEELKTINILGESNQIVGFLAENGQYHALEDVIKYSSPRGRSNEIASEAVKTITIDRMLFSNYGHNFYGLSDKMLLIDGADSYLVNDGSSWNSGAGRFSSSSAYLDHVEVNNETILYHFKNPSDFQQTDYGYGENSAQGTLRPLTPLIIEAALGSRTGKLIAAIELISNDATWYDEPRFNYFSAPVGSVLHLEITYTLPEGTTFSRDLFNSHFTYSSNGWVDFVNPISAPKPINLEIKGSKTVLENSSGQYTAVVTYDNNSKKNVSEAVVWNVSPRSTASVNQGLVSTADLLSEKEAFILTASYTYNDITVDSQLEIECVSEAFFCDEDWPMFQGNKKHTGYFPISLNTVDFTKKWERDFNRAIHPAVAADGKVFISTPSRFQDGDSLFALDDHNGDLLWSKNLGTASSVNPPAYAYGNIYIQTGKNDPNSLPAYVSAFNAETGVEIFRAKYEAQWESHNAPTIYKGSIYVNGGYYGGMYRYDAFDGSQKWFTSLAQYDGWTPAVDDKYAYAYVGGLLSIVDRLNGQVAGSIQDPKFEGHGWGADLAPVIGSCNDILIGSSGNLNSFDLDTHTIKYQIEGNFTNQPSVAHGCIYTINGGMLDVRDELTGNRLWTWSPPEGRLTGSLIVTDTHVLTTTASHTYAVKLSVRRADWRYPAAGFLSLGRKALYIGSQNGLLTAIAIHNTITKK